MAIIDKNFSLQYCIYDNLLYQIALVMMHDRGIKI